MDTELMLDVGQANELKLAFRRAGYTNADIKKLCEDDLLARLLPVVHGNAKISLVKHIIDCDADPFIPSGWKIEDHRKMGGLVVELKNDELYLGGKKVSLYLSKPQKKGKTINGHDLHKDLDDEPVLNANVLDYLFENTNLIPESWKRDA